LAEQFMSGFAQYGNFWNYYEFNKVDERLRFLDQQQVEEIFQDKIQNTDPLLVLDIGCNEGNLTLTVEQILSARFSDHPIHFMGIDIDHELINRANKKKNNSTIQFLCDDITKSNLPNEFLQSHGVGR
jgi:2-polyprenyl-3-methyl-5-hydroxy-6-metoxy-1,4-benzoquinol methylase